MSTWDILIQFHRALLDGLVVTLQLAFVAWLVGLAIGVPFGILANQYAKTAGYLLRALSFTLAAIPPIVLLYWFHYPLQQLIGINFQPFVTASLVLSLLNIGIVAEIVRAGLDGFPKQYRLAGLLYGMTPIQTFRYIEFPLIFRQVLPGLLATEVFILQGTIFASLISVEELFRVAQRIDSSIYRSIQIYSALAIFFVAICMPLYGLAFILRRRFASIQVDR